MITRADPPICQVCRALEREPQGEVQRLFTPADAPMPGQTSLKLE